MFQQSQGIVSQGPGLRARQFYVAALFLLPLLGFASYHNLRLARTSETQIESYRLLLEEADNFLSYLTDAETGQRGYLLTGKESYLAPYDAALPKIKVALSKMRKLAQASPGELSLIKHLESTADAKLRELARTITLRKTTGLNTALNLVRTDLGREAMEQARLTVVSIKTGRFKYCGTSDKKLRSKSDL